MQQVEAHVGRVGWGKAFNLNAGVGRREFIYHLVVRAGGKVVLACEHGRVPIAYWAETDTDQARLDGTLEAQSPDGELVMDDVCNHVCAGCRRLNPTITDLDRAIYGCDVKVIDLAKREGPE